MADPPVKVKNRAPAPIQITAEQLLREAAEFQQSAPKRARTEPTLIDADEVAEYQGRKRQEFEQVIQRTRTNFAAWAKYGNWEAANGGYARARSVFERALDVDPTNMKLWLSYTELELKGENLNHARNLYDRVTKILPRVDQMWYKYVHLEETLGNIPGTRQVFEKWMSWEPDEKAWMAYIKMELRYKEYDRASNLYERMVNAHPEPKSFIAWARFEEDERGNIERATEVYSMAFEYFGQDTEDEIYKSQSIYTSFAKMQTRAKNFDKARDIYRFVMNRLPRSRCSQVLAAYTQFEKQHGSQEGVDLWVAEKRRIAYEAELKQDPSNIDTWLDLIRLEEESLKDARHHTQTVSSQQISRHAIEHVREVYERAVQHKPSDNIFKQNWRRYIYIWLFWAAFEEVSAQNPEKARDVYKQCMDTIPHQHFTFAKFWIQYALFELRQKRLDQARKIMGTAIGLAPKPKSFSNYIDLELRLREFDRIRALYERWLQYDPSSAATWIKFAELEAALANAERARGLYELALNQPGLDMPELIWKSYIDFEVEEEEIDNARALYRRLIEQNGSPYVKVWLALARFEETIQESTSDARAVYKEAYEYFKNHQKEMDQDVAKQNRLVILEAWKNFESTHGDQQALADVVAMFPRQVKNDEDGTYELVFPDDAKPINKLLEMAHQWKKQKEEATRT